MRPVSEETARVAHAAFPTGNMYLRLHEEIDSIYEDEAFTKLFPTRGQPAEAPSRLALVTVLQFVEGLSDRQAADAVRARIDWKYLLGLELMDPGFDHTVLSEFRTRLVDGHAERVLLDTVLRRAQALGLFYPRGRQRTDSTHVLAAVRVLNRLERVGETLRAALNSLAVVAPDWLGNVVPAVWYERYGSRVENYDLPKTETADGSWPQQSGPTAKSCSKRSTRPSNYRGYGRFPRCECFGRFGLSNTLTRLERSAGVKSKRSVPQRT